MSSAAENPFGDARWITAPPDLPRLPIFRRSFVLKERPRRAHLSICGLGHFELRINGRKVGNDELSPGWTNYRKTCLFMRYDVAPLLQIGENVIAVLLGNGMYHVAPPADGTRRYRKFKGSFGRPKLICRMVNDDDEVRSDATWKCAAGPITFSCIYGGEDHDARLEIEGWDLLGFDDSAWPGAIETDGPGGELIEQTAPPVRVMQTFEPIARKEDVFDLGQNFAGRPVLTINGPAGATVKLFTGELLDAEGRVSQKNTGSPAWFAYTKRSNDPETWRPRFSYTGFRYVGAQCDALNATIDVRGEFLHAAVETIGQFECSNDLLNRIHQLIVAAVRSNTQSVFTDCPHREKLGWLEQTHLMAPSVLYNFDAREMYRKVSRDMRDAQHADGCVPTIAPQYTSFKPPWDIFNDSPEWGSAAVLNPWLVYQLTGDRRLIEEDYDVMRRYVEYLASRATDGIVEYGLSDWYDVGDGDPGFCKLTSIGLTATAIYFLDLQVMERVARLLGRGEDACGFADQAARVRRAFNARFFNSSTRAYDRGSQTAQAMPLALGLVEDEHRQSVLAHLVADIRNHGNHITAGDIGLKFVFDALSAAGRSEVIFDCLSRTDPPSYGCQLERGATALTEAWDANPKNSHNHMMLGHVEAWFYEHLAGIRIDYSQPDPITIRPRPVGDVTWVKAWHRTPAGRVGVSWRRDGERLLVELEIPHGTTAVVDDPSGLKRMSGGNHSVEMSV